MENPIALKNMKNRADYISQLNSLKWDLQNNNNEDKWTCIIGEIDEIITSIGYDHGYSLHDMSAAIKKLNNALDRLYLIIIPEGSAGH